MNDSPSTIRHRMIPGTHEWPREPECVCGSPYDWWNDRCPSAEGVSDGQQ
jgi:hypothetical protein